MVKLEHWHQKFLSYVWVGDGCWPWDGHRDTKDGYGQFTLTHLDTTDGKRRERKAHALMYELMVGPIPEGHEIDHMCRNKACVNPDHLEAVTHLVNIRRKKNAGICKRGHLLEHTRRKFGTRYSRCGVCWEMNLAAARESRRARGLKRPGRKPAGTTS